MSWRKSSRLVASTAAVPAKDTAALRRVIKEERRISAEQASGLMQRLSQADQLRNERVLAVRHAACLIAAVRATVPLRQTAENARRQFLLNTSLREELCKEEDALTQARRDDLAATLQRWRRRLAGADAEHVQAVQQEQTKTLQELAVKQARLEQDIYLGVAAVICESQLEVPAGVPEHWEWMSLLDSTTQEEVQDNCAVVDCAYMQRLAGVWARHNFCGGAHDFSLLRLTGFVATVQFCPEDLVCCWSHVELIYPVSTVGREELMMDLMTRIRPAALERNLVTARAQRRKWSAVLPAHLAAIDDWKMQKEVLGKELEAQVVASLQQQCHKQEMEKQHAETQRRAETLHRRLHEWRERATKAARHRQQVAAQQQAETRQKFQMEVARETARRQRLRQRVTDFQERRAQQQRLRLEDQQRRDEEAAQHRKLEAGYRRRRIQLRHQLRDQQQLQQVERQRALAELVEDRERRLEALRSEVRPEAACNTARLVAETQSTWARRGDQQPAPPPVANHSFWDSQLTGDRRTRLEARLREAGVLESGYAREVLQALVPATKPHLQPAYDWAQGTADGGGDQ